MLMDRNSVTNSVINIPTNVVAWKCRTYCIMTSSFVAFLSTNIYWLLTVRHVSEVKRFGQPGVASGFRAARLLIEKFGFDAYLHGMLNYYLASVLCCLFVWALVAKRNFGSTAVISFVVSLLTALVYYLIDLRVRVFNALELRHETAGLLETLKNIDSSWLILSIMAISVMFFVAALINVIICKSVVVRLASG